VLGVAVFDHTRSAVGATALFVSLALMTLELRDLRRPARFAIMSTGCARTFVGRPL
jgi:hypothetical protein